MEIIAKFAKLFGFLKRFQSAINSSWKTIGNLLIHMLKSYSVTTTSHTFMKILMYDRVLFSTSIITLNA